MDSEEKIRTLNNLLKKLKIDDKSEAELQKIVSSAVDLIVKAKESFDSMVNQKNPSKSDLLRVKITNKEIEPYLKKLCSIEFIEFIKKNSHNPREKAEKVCYTIKQVGRDKKRFINPKENFKNVYERKLDFYAICLGFSGYLDAKECDFDIEYRGKTQNYNKGEQENITRLLDIDNVVVKRESKITINEGGTNNFLILGKFYSIEEKYSKAVLCFEKLVELNSKNLDFLCYLVEAYIRNKEFKRAISVLVSIYNIDPFSDDWKDSYDYSLNSWSIILIGLCTAYENKVGSNIEYQYNLRKYESRLGFLHNSYYYLILKSSFLSCKAKIDKNSSLYIKAVTQYLKLSIKNNDYINAHIIWSIEKLVRKLLSEQEFQKTYSILMIFNDYSSNNDVSAFILRKIGQCHLEEAELLKNEKRYQNAIEAFLKSLRLDSENAYAINQIEWCLQERIKLIKDTQCYNNVIEKVKIYTEINGLQPHIIDSYKSLLSILKQKFILKREIVKMKNETIYFDLRFFQILKDYS